MYIIDADRDLIDSFRFYGYRYYRYTCMSSSYYMYEHIIDIDDTDIVIDINDTRNKDTEMIDIK